MKNCPWFSLRSNSIELRFRSVRWGNFLVNTGVTLKKSKRNLEFASLIKLFYSLRSIQEQISARNLRFLRLKRTKKCFSEGLGANFDSSLVDTRSMHLSKVKIPLYFALICVLSCFLFFAMRSMLSR